MFCSSMDVCYLLGYVNPYYFILVDAIVSGIVFVISFSDYSLFVHENITDFCVLTYPATMQNSFISSIRIFACFL